MTNDNRVDPTLRALVESTGPYLSLYLNTEGAREEAPHELSLRWRAFRERAEAEGASDKALRFLDDVVDGAHRRGDALVAIAAGDEVALRRHLPTRIADAFAVGPVPHLIPLIDWRQENPSYAVVIADRVGAEIHVHAPFRPEEVTEVQGDHDVIQKVKVGGTLEARYQRRAEDSWEQNAKAVAAELNRLGAREHLDFVVIAGDVRAIEFLKEHVGAQVDAISFEISSEPFAIDELAPDLERAVKAYAARTGEEILDRFGNARGQADLAADGAVQTLQALQQSQVDTLLLSTSAPDRLAWVSTSAAQGALERADLETLGFADGAEAPVVDVFVYLALRTGAAVRVIPEGQDELGPAEGIGAILRFS